MRYTVVTPANYESVCALLWSAPLISVDTETTGLRPHHGDRIFAMSFATENEAFYLDFTDFSYTQIFDLLRVIFQCPTNLIFMHNAKFDLAMIAKTFQIEMANFFMAKVHCTLTMARLERNDHMSYSLDACAARIGLKKDNTVKKWLEENKAFTWETIPGKQARHKNWHFQQVPFDIMSKYAMVDAEVTYELGKYQLDRFKAMEDAAATTKTPPITRVADNERQLTKTTLAMEMAGLRVNINYITQAIMHQEKRIVDAIDQFTALTGEKFKASSKLFEEVFAADRPSWGYTEKGNPSFDSEHLKKFKSPAAAWVLEYRDAKAKSDFFNGFLYHADATGFVHPHFNPFGTATGRFSSSDPNFQNLTSEEAADDLYPIRRAIVTPSSEYFIVSIDYVAMEYIKLLELAARLTGQPSELLIRVRAGADVHQATADIAKEFGGVEITRKAAKMTNFLTIYGGGDKKLAEGLGITVDEARKIRAAIFKGCPDIKKLMDAVSKTAEVRKYVFNWMGRVSHFPDYRFCYKALNYLIQGGCADVMKVAMNKCAIRLQTSLTRMVMTIHDELVFYVHKEEAHLVPDLARLMESSFPHQFIGMRVSIEASMTDLESLTPWEEFKEANGIQA